MTISQRPDRCPDLPAKPAIVSLAMVALILVSCGPRKAPDSKRRTVDGHFARTISGQIPLHGSVYSSKEVEIMLARLNQDSKDVLARQKLAEALARLNQYEEALREIKTLETTRPGRFETLFLKARVLENMDNLPDAIAAAEQALKLQSSGHDETGPYFLNMYSWKLARQEGTALPINFLGVSYSLGPDAVAESEDFNQQHLLGLLELFPTFFDGFMTLGDWLTSQGKDQLSVRAYLRALQLAPDGEDKIRIGKRLRAVESRWEAKAMETASLVFDPDYRALIEQEFEAAAAWQIEYERREQELVRSMPDAPPLAPDDASEETKTTALNARHQALAAMQLPDADLVTEHMKMRNYSGPAYYHAGLVVAKPPPWHFFTGGSPYLWAIAAVGSLAVFFASRKISNIRKTKRYQGW